MHIEVYIFGMEMSQRVHFLYQILLKIRIFRKDGKKLLFWYKKFLDSLQKNSFELKMLNLI